MIAFAKKRYYFSDKGLQEKTSILVMTPQELQIARNVHYFERGSLTKRQGYEKRFTNDITGTPKITGLYQLVNRDSTKNFITTGDKLYKGDQGDSAVTEIGGSLTFTPGGNGENFNSMITFNNQALGANGVENAWAWSGSGDAAALGGSPPIAPIIAKYRNFVFLAGNPTNPFRLFFSNDGDETTWTGTDFIDIGDLTEPITGLAVLFGELVIFTRRGMHGLRGFDRDTFAVSEITLSTGCVSYKSVVKVDNNLVFWSDRGPYSFDGIKVKYLGEFIETFVANLNYSRVDKIVGELYKAKNQVWWSVSTGSNVNHNQVVCMTYNPTASEGAGIDKESIAFANYTGMAFNAFGLERSLTELDRLYSGNYSGRVHQQDKGENDDGSGIDFIVKTPPIDMDNPEVFKRFRYIWIFVKQEGNYNLSISYITDFGLGGSTTTQTLSVAGSASLWGSLIWGTDVWGGGSIVKSRVGLKAKGHFLELTFSNGNIDQPISIKGFTSLAQLKGTGRE